MTAAFKKRIDRLILGTVHRIGGRRFIRRRIVKGHFPILAYHEIERSNFENHIRFLRSVGFSIVSMDQVGQALRERRPLPTGSLAITFDDGWKSNYSEVFPIACKNAVPVTIYLVSNVYSAGIKPWFFRHAEMKSSGVTDLPDVAEPDILPAGIPNPLLAEFMHRHGGRINRSHTLSPDEVNEMRRSEFISFGSHTLTHAVLDQLPAEAAAREITESRLALETLLNSQVRHFAYPKGVFSAEHPGMVRLAGYETAVTVVPGWNDPKTLDNYALRRIVLSAGDDVAVLSAKLSGFWYCLRRARKGFA